MAQTTTVSLNQTQQKILSVISRQGAISLGSLTISLSPYKPHDLSFDGWKQEIEMQCRLFALRGLLTTKKSKNTVCYQADKRLVQWKQRPVQRKNSMSPLRYKPIPALLLASSLLVLNGCSMMPAWMKPSDSQSAVPTNARKLPVYNADGWLPPERMEQFQVPGKGMVYRYCTTDCPEPTPKLQRVYSSTSGKGAKPSRNAFISTYSTAPIPMMAQTPDEVAQIQENANMEGVIAEAEAYLRDNPIPKSAQKPAPTPTPVAPSTQADNKLSAVSANLASALNKAAKGQPRPTLKEDLTPAQNASKTQRVEKSPQASNVSTSLKGANKITFVGNKGVLTEAGKEAALRLAEQADNVDLITLRGHAAHIENDEELYYRESVARALAVRSELVKAGVPREKIRIRKPNMENMKQQDASTLAYGVVATLFSTKNQNDASVSAPTKNTEDGGKV